MSAEESKALVRRFYEEWNKGNMDGVVDVFADDSVDHNPAPGQAQGKEGVRQALAGFIIIWRFAARRTHSETAERRAQQLIAASYLVLAAYIVIASARSLIGGHHPDASWIGIGLAAFTAPTMPVLARAKRRVGRELGSSATVSEAEQNQICAYLSIALLVGLLANALAGWWWADPAAAVVIAAVVGREGWESWKGDSCDCC